MLFQTFNRHLFALNNQIELNFNKLESDHYTYFQFKFKTSIYMILCFSLSIGFVGFYIYSFWQIQKESKEILKLFLEIPKERVKQISKNANKFVNFCKVC